MLNADLTPIWHQFSADSAVSAQDSMPAPAAQAPITLHGTKQLFLVAHLRGNTNHDVRIYGYSLDTP